MVCARDAVAAFWDAVVRDALAGVEPQRTVPSLRRWFDAYRGGGRGRVTVVAGPEPYIGPLHVDQGMPRLVALGLNPGRADIAFQGPGGVFAREYEQVGGFSAWAVTEPYLRDPWRGVHGRNRYHESLRAFARRWLDDPSVQGRDVLALELYPWHSDAVTGVIVPDPDLIDEFIWRPISELAVNEVIAIGSDWQRVAERLALPEQRLEVLFTDRTRRVRSFGLRSGRRLIVTWHQASNSPPNASDAAALRCALGSRPSNTSLPVDHRITVERARRSRRRVARGGVAPSGKQAYQLFWAQMTDRLRREHPTWSVGSANRNDYPLFSPLPGSRLKCNFSRAGLRVELLLQSTDRATNLRRLEVLIRNLPNLQAALGPSPILKPEPLDGRTQARIAAYRSGTIDEQQSWPAFLDWFLSTTARLEHALTASPAIHAEWPP